MKEKGMNERERERERSDPFRYEVTKLAEWGDPSDRCRLSITVYEYSFGKSNSTSLVIDRGFPLEKMRITL